MEGYKKDAQGRLVPVETIKEIDILRDELVQAIAGKAIDLGQEIAQYRQQSLNDIKAFVGLSVEKYGVSWGGRKGNITLNSYDGSLRVLIAVDETITFDERLQAAKQLIDECIVDWSSGSRPELRAIINDAFSVDRVGRINTKRVLGLRRLEITDPKWQEAMRAISDSVLTVSSREYIRIYRRDEDGVYQLVNLDIAAA